MSAPRNAKAPEGRGSALGLQRSAFIPTREQHAELSDLMEDGRGLDAQRLILAILNGDDRSHAVGDPCASHGPYGGQGPVCVRCGYPAGRRVIELGPGR